jgi:hypothetical protein
VAPEDVQPLTSFQRHHLVAPTDLAVDPEAGPGTNSMFGTAN